MHVMITGAAGYIGARLYLSLLELGGSVKEIYNLID